jgi:glycosyltransferase involved in cell wall biosynthesis
MEPRALANQPPFRSLISIVVPCFNEEQSIPDLYRELNKAFAACTDVDCRFVFIDDGSIDRTAEILGGLAAGDPRVTVVTARAHGPDG